MRKNTIHGNRSEHFGDLKENNVAKIPPRSTKLLCGHYVTGHPIAIYPSKRELYNCPQCDCLVKAVAR